MLPAVRAMNQKRGGRRGRISLCVLSFVSQPLREAAGAEWIFFQSVFENLVFRKTEL
jgi:hypothetical protein